MSGEAEPDEEEEAAAVTAAVVVEGGGEDEAGDVGPTRGEVRPEAAAVAAGELKNAGRLDVDEEGVNGDRGDGGGISFRLSSNSSATKNKQERTMNLAFQTRNWTPPHPVYNIIILPRLMSLVLTKMGT